ncbi:MAG: hypothetical protein ACRCV3_01985 [Desulfovibrionaceae bacterium]
MSYVLKCRLKECLQTIIDLEVEIERIELETSFLKELNLLKNFVKKIDTVNLSEEEVLRIESVTEHFLREFTEHPIFEDVFTKSLRNFQ